MEKEVMNDVCLVFFECLSDGVFCGCRNMGRDFLIIVFDWVLLVIVFGFFFV